MIINLEHSVRARLQNEARASGRPFQEVLQYFGLERFHYRLSRGEYAPTQPVDPPILRKTLA
jgi:hypothetical protein